MMVTHSNAVYTSDVSKMMRITKETIEESENVIIDSLSNVNITQREKEIEGNDSFFDPLLHVPPSSELEEVPWQSALFLVCMHIYMYVYLYCSCANVSIYIYIYIYI